MANTKIKYHNNVNNTKAHGAINMLETKAIKPLIIPIIKYANLPVFSNPYFMFCTTSDITEKIFVSIKLFFCTLGFVPIDPKIF